MNIFYEFDSFWVDEEKRILEKNGMSVSIKPKTFDTLLALLKSENKVISKDKLIEEIWNGTAVSDDSLTQQISKLRKLLGDSAEKGKFIVTIPGVGYKFVADVNEKISTNGGASLFEKPSFLEKSEDANRKKTKNLDIRNIKNKVSLESTSAEGGPKKIGNNQKWNWGIAAVGLLIIGLAGLYIWKNLPREETTVMGVEEIAVLPFRAPSQDDELKSLKQGMTDTLVSRLSRIEAISVLPSFLTSSFEKSNLTPSEFGKKINADAVLEGRLQKHEKKIRVTVQLIESSTGKVLWSEEFTSEFTDIFEVQSAIAYRIAEALSLELTDEESLALMKKHTTSSEAYRLYLDARYLWGNRSTGEARVSAQKSYERAIQLDPDFALAYVGLAELLINEASEENYRKVKYLGRKALEIDPSSSEALEILAFAVWRGDWNWKEAEELTRKAIEFDANKVPPHATLLMILYGQGRFEEAFEALEKIPKHFSSTAEFEISLYYYSRKYEKAISFGKEKLAKRPNNINLKSYMGPAYTELGNFEKALEATEDYVALDSLAYPGSLCYLGYTYAKSGQKNKAKEILQKILREEMPKESQTHGGLAMLYGELGEKDKAFEHVEKSIENREWWAFTLKVAPYYDSLRDDPRFEKMLKKINLAS